MITNLYIYIYFHFGCKKYRFSCRVIWLAYIPILLSLGPSLSLSLTYSRDIYTTGQFLHGIYSINSRLCVYLYPRFKAHSYKGPMHSVAVDMVGILTHTNQSPTSPCKAMLMSFKMISSCGSIPQDISQFVIKVCSLKGSPYAVPVQSCDLTSLLVLQAHR